MDKVWVVYTYNDDGYGISVHSTRNRAVDSLFHYVELCWLDYCTHDIPENKEQAISDFFYESEGVEEYHIEEYPIDGVIGTGILDHE